MTFKLPSKIVSQNIALNRWQEQALRLFKDVTGKTILDGELVEDVELVGSSYKHVSHGLGRKVRGWIIVASDADTSGVYGAQADNDFPETTLYLYNSGSTATVSLWVF